MVEIEKFQQADGPNEICVVVLGSGLIKGLLSALFNNDNFMDAEMFVNGTSIAKCRIAEYSAFTLMGTYGGAYYTAVVSWSEKRFSIKGHCDITMSIDNPNALPPDMYILRSPD